MHNVSGVSGAAPVWREIVMALHDGNRSAPSRAPAPPARLLASAGEWYLAGTEPRAGFAAGRAGAFGIDSPREGMVMVLDPEIPAAAQRLVMRGAAGEWWLDGRRLGQGTRLEWLPRPGRHVLERRDAVGSDRVQFEVRAAPPPRRPPAAAASTPRRG